MQANEECISNCRIEKMQSQQQSPNQNTQQLQQQAVTQQTQQQLILPHQQQQQQTQLVQNQGNTVGKINDTQNLSSVGK